jgi:hypothetical protein
MSNTIQIKRSTTAGAVPTAGQLAVGELAVNLADRKLFTKNASNVVVPVTNAPDSGFSFRNRIINGDMRIAQRGTAAVTGDGDFPVDRYKIQYSMDGAISLQQDSSAPTGFINSTKITVTTADASLGTSQFAIFRHFIEGTNISDLAWGSASAKTITLSFWVRSSLTGTFGGSLNNSANTRSYPFTYTISAADTWEQKIVTIAGDTSGTWLTTTGVGIRINWSLGAGTDFLATAGSWVGAEELGATGQTNVLATLNATFYITGVQLEAGSTATPFERRPFGTELQLCQRYFFQGSISMSGVIGGGSGTVPFGGFSFVVPMRAVPTTTRVSGGNSDNGSDGTAITGLQSTDQTSVYGQRIFFTTGVNQTIGRGCAIGGAVMTFSAEL